MQQILNNPTHEIQKKYSTQKIQQDILKHKPEHLFQWRRLAKLRWSFSFLALREEKS